MTKTLSHVRESGFRIPRNLCFWNPESLALESGIQLKESVIPLTTGFVNRSPTVKEPESIPGIRSPRRGIQNPGVCVRARNNCLSNRKRAFAKIISRAEAE